MNAHRPVLLMGAGVLAATFTVFAASASNPPTPLDTAYAKVQADFTTASSDLVVLGQAISDSSSTSVAPSTTAATTVAPTVAPTTTAVPTTTAASTTTVVATTSTTVAPSAFPTAATTGIPAGTTLTPAAGFTANVNGATYTNLQVNGNIVVTATNVTFTNVKVLGVRWYAVTINAGASATFNHCDISGTATRVTPVYVLGTATLNFCHVHDGDIDVFMGTTGTAYLNDSLLDDLWGSNEAGPGPSHNDALKFNGGGTATVTHSTLKGQWGAHGGNGGGISAAFHNSGGNAIVTGSFLGLEDSPNSYVVYYVSAGAHGSVTNSVFEHFNAARALDKIHALSTDAAASTPIWSGNTWTDGTPA